MNARIDRLLPHPTSDLDDDGILAHYAVLDSPWLRVNFVSSLDGAATRDGRSGGLGDAADRRVFELLRRLADVVLVGAGTIRTEGYGGFRLADADTAWRVSHGAPAHPVLAIVSGSLDLDPSSEVFTDAPTRPIVYTLGTASVARRAALSEVADVVVAGGDALDLRAVRTDLEARGLERIHSEGGPHLFGSFISAGVADELCLTIAPTLEGGAGPRIAVSASAVPQRMRLAGLLQSGDELFLRMVARETPSERGR